MLKPDPPLTPATKVLLVLLFVAALVGAVLLAWDGPVPLL